MVIEEPVEQILDIQSQDGTPTIWVLINTELKKDPTALIAIGTGWELPPDIKDYVGTAQDSFGFVWHYFLLEGRIGLLKKEKEKEMAIEEAFAVLAEAVGKAGMTAEELSEALKN